MMYCIGKYESLDNAGPRVPKPTETTSSSSAIALSIASSWSSSGAMLANGSDFTRLCTSYEAGTSATSSHCSLLVRYSERPYSVVRPEQSDAFHDGNEP